MRNRWYSDKRDLVKWSILIHLARMTAATRILQIAYFRQEPNRVSPGHRAKIKILISISGRAIHNKELRVVDKLPRPLYKRGEK